MDDYIPNSELIEERIFFPRAPVDRPYGNLGTVTLTTLIQDEVCGWIGYCEFQDCDDEIPIGTLEG